MDKPWFYPQWRSPLRLTCTRIQVQCVLVVANTQSLPVCRTEGIFFLHPSTDAHLPHFVLHALSVWQLMFTLLHKASHSAEFYWFHVSHRLWILICILLRFLNSKRDLYQRSFIHAISLYILRCSLQINVGSFESFYNKYHLSDHDMLRIIDFLCLAAFYTHLKSLTLLVMLCLLYVLCKPAFPYSKTLMATILKISI